MNELEPIKYSKDTFKTENFCLICLNQYSDDDNIVILPCDARHNFHEACIKEWLRNKNKCPICRTPVTESNLREFSLVQMLDKLKNEST